MLELENSNLNEPKGVKVVFRDRRTLDYMSSPLGLRERFSQNQIDCAGYLTITPPEEEFPKWYALRDTYPESIELDGDKFFLWVTDSHDGTRHGAHHPFGFLSCVSVLTPYTSLEMTQMNEKEPTFNLSMTSPIEIIKLIDRTKGRKIRHRSLSRSGEAVSSPLQEFTPNSSPQYESMRKFLYLTKTPFPEIYMVLGFEEIDKEHCVVSILDSNGDSIPHIPKVPLIFEDDKYFVFGKDMGGSYFDDEELYATFLREFNKLSPIPGIKDIKITHNDAEFLSLDMIL